MSERGHVAGGGAGAGVRLGVNIDHVATLRQVRRVTYPSVTEAARLCEQAGAHGITIHLREDRRHIQDADLAALRAQIGIPLNLEIALRQDMRRIACGAGPDEVCLVPERREELTTEGGLDVAGQAGEVRAAVREFQAAGIVVSLFIAPDPVQVDAAAASGAEFIELHTGAYCGVDGLAAERELERLIAAAVQAHGCGLRVNAGHGITLDNMSGILKMPHLDTLNIGHSIVSRAIMVGLAPAVREMLAAMSAYRRATA